jgi:hypothetical protein
MVVLIGVEVLPQLIDARGQNCYLYFGRPCVAIVHLVVVNDFLLALRLQSQIVLPPAGAAPVMPFLWVLKLTVVSYQNCEEAILPVFFSPASHGNTAQLYHKRAAGARKWVVSRW